MSAEGEGWRVLLGEVNIVNCDSYDHAVCFQFLLPLPHTPCVSICHWDKERSRRLSHGILVVSVKKNKEGLALCCSELSSHLKHPHLVVRILVLLVQIHFPANMPGKGAEDGLGASTSATHLGDQRPGFLTTVWGMIHQMEGSISPSHFITLAFQLDKNKAK